MIFLMTVGSIYKQTNKNTRGHYVAALQCLLFWCCLKFLLEVTVWHLGQIFSALAWALRSNFFPASQRLCFSHRMCAASPSRRSFVPQAQVTFVLLWSKRLNPTVSFPTAIPSFSTVSKELCSSTKEPEVSTLVIK